MVVLEIVSPEINRYGFFSEIFSNKNFPLPVIAFGYQYWWPTFKVTFDSLSAYQAAKREGLLTRFEKEIGDMYGSDFEPARAITYLYPDNKHANT